VRRFNGKNM
jgi:hypothetical protein